MAFYNNEVVLSHTNEDEIYVFKKNKNIIIMDYYNKEENSVDEVLIDDLLDKFDVMLMEDGKIYLIYQSLEYNIKMLEINKSNSKTINLTDEKLSKILQINLFEVDTYTNIIYLTRGIKENTYSIKHHILMKDNWNSFDVEDIITDGILNPVKIIRYKEDFLLLYYNENTICIKRFNSKEKSWEESKMLTDNNKKLYIDGIISEEYLHLSYCEFIKENLEIKYIRYNLKENLQKSREDYISHGINPTNPTLLIYDEKIWIVWNESLNLYSRYSEDYGNTWSPIYLWKDVKKEDFARYKYVDNRNDTSLNLDYCFGTLGEDIKFLGFGALENVEEIDKKKLQNQAIYPTMIRRRRRV